MSEYAKEINVASPAFNAKCSEGDDSIRDLKVALKERFDTDHYWEGEATVEDKIADGKHRKITMINSNGVPDVVENSIILNCQDSSGKAELFFKHEDNKLFPYVSKRSGVNEVLSPGSERTIILQNTYVGEVYKLCFAKHNFGTIVISTVNVNLSTVQYPPPYSFQWSLNGPYPINFEFSTRNYSNQYSFYPFISVPTISNGVVATNIPISPVSGTFYYFYQATPIDIYSFFILFKITSSGTSTITVKRQNPKTYSGVSGTGYTDAMSIGETKVFVKKIGII